MKLTRRNSMAILCAAPLAGQEKKGGNTYPPQLEGAKAEVYKRAGDVELKVWIYTPEGHKASDNNAAIVFFFGGGWTNGSPKQFEQHCKHLASRGMVAMTADYRVASRHKVKVDSCIMDAKSAIRWVRANAARLGVDANRIAAGGGSAGGHLAAAAGVIPGFEEPMKNPSKDREVSSRPNALVLFNPALVMANAPEAGVSRDDLAGLVERYGAAPEAVSPYHHVKQGDPPAIMFHGKADTTVPYRTAEAFAEKMKEAGNRCELVGYEGQTHGFFNYGRGNNEYFDKTMRRADEFLNGLNYLKA